MEEKICFGNTTHIEPTNFDRCIICQKETHANLQKVTSVESLRYAVTQRQDSIARRLEHIVTSDSQNDKNIYWHGDCRRWYTLKKVVILLRSGDKASSVRKIVSNLVHRLTPQHHQLWQDRKGASWTTSLNVLCARSPSRHARRPVWWWPKTGENLWSGRPKNWMTDKCRTKSVPTWDKIWTW